jgi:SAM-dependent methyltransferase
MYQHTEEAHNLKAATEVVPILIELFNPQTVLDVGCGTGTWLKIFSELREQIYLQGLDGDYIDRSKLTITKDWLKTMDLSKPFNLNKRFDLVMSLEVAEHLPPSSDKDFISSLVNHGDTILFSAAVPMQGGDNHLHEKWPSYWSSLFAQHGYHAYDIIRPIIWNNNKVDRWYKQNTIVYSNKVIEFKVETISDIVHPDYWIKANQKIESYQQLLKRIEEGKVGLAYPLKSLLRSLFRLGKKIND